MMSNVVATRDMLVSAWMTARPVVPHAAWDPFPVAYFVSVLLWSHNTTMFTELGSDAAAFSISLMSWCANS